MIYKVVKANEEDNLEYRIAHAQDEPPALEGFRQRRWRLHSIVVVSPETHERHADLRIVLESVE